MNYVFWWCLPFLPRALNTTHRSLRKSSGYARRIFKRHVRKFKIILKDMLICLALSKVLSCFFQMSGEPETSKILQGFNLCIFKSLWGFFERLWDHTSESAHCGRIMIHHHFSRMPWYHQSLVPSWFQVQHRPQVLHPWFSATLPLSQAVDSFRCVCCAVSQLGGGVLWSPYHAYMLGWFQHESTHVTRPYKSHAIPARFPGSWRDSIG